MQHLSRRSGWLKAAAASVGTLLAFTGLAAPAHAAPVIDNEQSGSITVHKYETPDAATGLPSNGTQITEADLEAYEPLDGVEFTVQQVEGIDLSTNAGWSDANDLVEAFVASAPSYAAEGQEAITSQGRTLGEASTQTTGADGADGQASFSALDLGLYLVTETSTPAGVTPAAPFLVTVPLTNPNNQSDWLYDVHVYPKNAVTTATKTVSDEDAVALGDDVTFTIEADIPNMEVIDGYRIVDNLSDSLDYVGTSVSLSNGTSITEGTHFTVVHDDVTNSVTVEFTEAGRSVLADNTSASVVVDITTQANAAGVIENEATVYPNDPSWENRDDPDNPNPPIVTPPTETRWGGITVQKHDPTGNGLSGAEFSVYTSEADALAGENPVELDGATVHEVDGDGELVLSGLRYSNYENGQLMSDENAFRTYWLVEVTAPEGYELLAEPIDFTVTGPAENFTVDVENAPSNAGFELPLTGSTGTTLLYLAGALLLAGAALMMIRSSRQGAK